MYTPRRKEPVRVKFEPERINALLGTNLSSRTDAWITCKRLNWPMTKRANEIIAPTFRQDHFPHRRSGRRSGTILWI